MGARFSFQIKPDHSLRMSLSFLDRNRVAYTAWTELKGGLWQLVRIPLDEIRPNPFFQPPDARTGRPIDVSDVKGIAFAPQDKTSGRLAIGKFVVYEVDPMHGGTRRDGGRPRCALGLVRPASR